MLAAANLGYVIPDVESYKILEAMRSFDDAEASLPKWQGWEKKSNFKFALDHDGRRYPVKRIIALATGTPEAMFSGGGWRVGSRSDPAPRT